MAATEAVKGFGLTAEYLSTAPSTYSAIGELLSATPPQKSREVIDATHMQSPGGYREFISSLRDGGEATLTFNYTADGYEVLEGMFDDDDPANFRITLSDGATIVFDGLVTEQPIDDIAIDDKIGMSATIKVTGPVTFTPGA
ncbi:hypothetical protein GCM10017620_24640 [Brevundimonas intermedia]|uniref:Lambda phage tail tube protein N-terminal domain-containing protein n=1 Tax=Brevundimonas intermedia TaxID=74315 RepID=A0ABQ5TA57_9CAUL|nr:phage tail tube protein [Brevundimonas intermedia]GLK49491.1 hypothetical protein GCM10017620_24640 [Brevundimonas intermedia]